MTQKFPMRIAALPAMLLATIVCAAPAFGQTNAHSSPEDRQRFVSIVQSLERAPLNPSLQDDRKWAIQWLIDAPDVSVTACLDPLGGVSRESYAHTPEIIGQYTIAMAAFIIENPGKANDPDAQQLAGVEGALNAYRSMRTAQPAKESPALEKLLGLRSRNELPGFVRKAYLRCLAKGAKEPYAP
ncbi:hypothetical protein [Sphingomonas sp.]|uniref:hypothetical protein n=1 Tax=Sphingomonas sp. TaxID=28214 RepID=UPI003D6C8859